MEQPAQISSQPIPPTVVTNPQPPPPSQKTNKPPLIILAVLVIALFGAGAFWLRKSSSGPKIVVTPTPTAIPTLIEAIPTLEVLATPTPDLTADWKTYTNDFAKFSLKYPDTLTFTEKSFSDKEKQVIFKGNEGSLTINMATSDYSPGWGGGCDPKDKKKITFLGSQVEVCLNDTGMHELYISHPSGKWQLNVSATFLGSPVKAQEFFDQILSTFKFLD